MRRFSPGIVLTDVSLREVLSMSLKSARSKKRKGRNTLSISTMVPFLRRKATSEYASKFTSSDPELRRMLKRSERSADAMKALRGRRDGANGQSSGVSRKARQSASIVRTLSVRNCEKLLSPLGEPLRLLTVGLVERTSNDCALLDFDSLGTPKLRACWRILALLDLRPRFILDIRSRHGWHRIIKLPRQLAPVELVALQSCLGSDPRREAFNLLRVLSLRKNSSDRFATSRWNLMFRRKLQ
jgi:hypothetical protein